MTDNPRAGVTEEPAVEPPEEIDLLVRCPRCGQVYDKRQLDQVLHHVPLLHEPMPES